MRYQFIGALVFAVCFFAVEAETFESKKNIQGSQIMDQVRVDIAELKGPPDVEVVISKQQEAADDLLLVINSGRYSGNSLNYLKSKHLEMLSRPKPTQADVNLAHKALINNMNNSLSSGRNPYQRRDFSSNLEDNALQMREMREQLNKTP